MKTSKKPIYPVLPSVHTAKEEIEEFLEYGRMFFADEALLGKAIVNIANTLPPQPSNIDIPKINKLSIRKIIDESDEGYLSPENVQKLIDACGIDRAEEVVTSTKKEAVEFFEKQNTPIVMKVVGPVHKSDVGGVILNVNSKKQVENEFDRMIKIEDTTAILLQPMLSGTELFVGAKFEENFGHQILCGLGGVFIEVLKDVSFGLSPISKDEANYMIKSLKSYKIIQGVRGQEPINEEKFIDVITRISALVEIAPEIAEMDINPLLGKLDKIVAVDARIRIEK